jgi:hypothetical protein
MTEQTEKWPIRVGRRHVGSIGSVGRVSAQSGASQGNIIGSVGRASARSGVRDCGPTWERVWVG